MNEYEERIEELENQIYKIIEFLKPIAIGSEQLWEVVYEDILDREVPNGVDSRKEYRDYFES